MPWTLLSGYPIKFKHTGWRFFFGFSHYSILVMRRRVECIDLEIFWSTCIYHIVLCSWWDDDSISRCYIVFISIDDDFSLSWFKPKKLISISVSFFSYFLSYEKWHKYELCMMTCIEDMTKICIIFCHCFDISKKSFHSRKVRI